ncbi:ABC transporter permease [Streptomyces sp. NBC_01261]|uniref:FtsX-like permease family protein n=1 Tax=unclassified Streptomyces TaxID=2593676 RepID=UPI002E28C278|nr:MULTISPECIES: FtsX-like permease family protein [unclassified Streptomyces]
MSGPHGSVTAPWIRTHLRSASGTAWALALLVAVTACLAAVFPRALDRYEDAGLRRSAAQAGPDRTSVQLSGEQPDPMLPPDQREAALRPDVLRTGYERARTVVGRPLVVDTAQSAYGVRPADEPAVPDPWIPRPNGLPAHVYPATQSNLAGHATVREGRLPRASAPVTAQTPEVEAAVTAATAKSLHIRVGSVVHLPGEGRGPLAVRVTGILVPRDPAGAYWSTQPLLRTPTLVALPTPDRPKYWLGALLLAPDAAPALLGTSAQPGPYWQLAPDLTTLHAHDLDRLKTAVASVESGPGLQLARTYTTPDTDVSTGLDDMFTAYGELRSGIRPLTAVAAFGTGTVALVVLLMTGGLTADRRRTELALLRARGASLRGLTARLLAETAVIAVPAGAVGLTAALLAAPEGRRAQAVAAALAVALTASAALPVRAALTHRTVRVHGPREDVTAVRPSLSRTVAELTLLVLASGAVEALRRRGTSGSAGDQLVALAPVLVGVIAALVLVRVYPPLLRRLARPASRLRGAVGHLSLARAGRTSVSAVLPLLALLTALTTAAFGGSVLAGVSDARDHAALLAVGADARVDATAPLPSQLPREVSRLPGVHGLAGVSITDDAKPLDGLESVPLVGVDPGDYAELAGHTGLGAFPEGQLKRRAGSGAVLPALASPSVARAYGTRPFLVRLPDTSAVTVRIVLVRDVTPAVSGADFLVVDRTGLSGTAARPSSLLVTGAHVSGSALRGAAGSSAGVTVRAEERARYVDSPLQSGAERIYTAAVAAGAGYAVLALLLSLLRAAPERAALLARLRTMGLTRAQGRRLLILESLPQAVLAAAGGALTGWATIRLLAPGMDLTSVALASAQNPVGEARLRIDPVSLAVPAIGVLLVAVGVAGVQAWWSGRQSSVRELRAGDAR